MHTACSSASQGVLLTLVGLDGGDEALGQQGCHDAHCSNLQREAVAAGRGAAHNRPRVGSGHRVRRPRACARYWDTSDKEQDDDDFLPLPLPSLPSLPPARRP